MSPAIPLLLIGLQLLIAPAIAIWRGGAPERRLAIAYWLDTVTTIAVEMTRSHRFQSPEWGVLVIDLIMLVYAIVLTTRANRWWPIWFTALHLVAVLTHIAKLCDPTIVRDAYYLGASFAAYPLWGLIVAGTVTHRARVHRNGSDPDWKSSFPQLIPFRQRAGQRPS